MWPQSLESKDKKLLLPLGAVPVGTAGDPAPLQPQGTLLCWRPAFPAAPKSLLQLTT